MNPDVILSHHTIGLYVIRALGIMGISITVFYYQKYDMGYVSKYVKEKIYTLHPERYEAGFIDLLLKHGNVSKGNNPL